MGTAANFTHDLDDSVARLARKRVSRKLGWYVHAFVFVTVNLGLAALARGTTGMTTAKSALRAGNYGPFEVSRAIDAITQDARFAPLVDAQRVGLWGMSAGGHTALTLAGGRWSPARLLAHCTGAASALNGNGGDGIKKAVAMPLIRWHLWGDNAWYGHTDARIQAIVAGVPVAADFDLATLAKPVVPLGLIQAGKDLWLVPKFHSAAVIEACKTCEVLANLPTAGHGRCAQDRVAGGLA